MWLVWGYLWCLYLWYLYLSLALLPLLGSQNWVHSRFVTSFCRLFPRRIQTSLAHDYKTRRGEHSNPVTYLQCSLPSHSVRPRLKGVFDSTTHLLSIVVALKLTLHFDPPRFPCSRTTYCSKASHIVSDSSNSYPCPSVRDVMVAVLPRYASTTQASLAAPIPPFLRACVLNLTMHRLCLVLMCLF